MGRQRTRDAYAVGNLAQGRGLGRLSAEAIPEPKFVRMGWRDVAIPNLKDKDAWPAFAFSSQPVTQQVQREN
jgi:hypothetical protein